MVKILDIKAREILDSRGNPTVECDVILENGITGRASTPSGASTGKFEALEIRDNDKKRYNGKGVIKVISNILDIVRPKVIDKKYEQFNEFDNELISIDGTNNKSSLGANCTLPLSLAFAKALSINENKNFYKFISDENKFTLPLPMINIINGGAHADNNVDIQEFMIAPVGAKNFKEAIRYGCEIFYSLKSILKSKGLNTNVGDEGGFAPNINSSKEVIDLILDSIESTGLKLNKDIRLSLDVASTEFFHNEKYFLKGENKTFDSEGMVKYLSELASNYPIYSIEDGMAENDWDGWNSLTKEIGDRIQLVGDDLFVTNIERLEKGIKNKSSNSILIKLNQIGTLSETLSAIKLAKSNNFSCIISHRSGETEDTIIADLAVGTSAGQIKTGSVSRTDRTSKYNQLIRIEEELGEDAIYSGNTFVKH
tara:strand:- start:469 stop:1746 length:1278 start_codon:yes stop_codon:yes gene_type:complete